MYQLYKWYSGLLCLGGRTETRGSNFDRVTYVETLECRLIIKV